MALLPYILRLPIGKQAMHLTEVKAFLSKVLIRMTNDATVKEITELNVNEHYWGEVFACDMITSDEAQWHISCRTRQNPLPSNYVDFLDIKNTQQHRHLIIIYLDSEEDELSQLSAKYIPAKQWQSVTHIDWAQTHPLKTNKQPISKTKLDQPGKTLLEGGIRLRSEQKETPREEQSTPLISIVTIVLNGDEYLEQTIQSVIHQKGSDVEYVVVDGGSTDDSMKIINQYSDHIDYWISEPDKGLYDALNRGIKLCRGEFIGAIHSNDFYASNTMTDLKKAIQQHPDTSFFYGNLWYLDTNTSWLRGREITSTFQMVMFGDFFHPTNFISRQSYAENGTYDLSYHIAADYDLGIRFWKTGLHFQYIPKALAYFRLGGLSGNLYQNQWQRHHIRVASGERYPYSLFIMVLVLGNYYLKNLGKACLKVFSRE